MDRKEEKWEEVPFEAGDDWTQLDAETGEGISDSGEVTLELGVTPRFDGLRLAHFVSRRLPNVPKKTAFRLIRAGKVCINGQQMEEDQVVKNGTWVTVTLRPGQSDPMEIPLRLEILHETPEFIVLNKPAGEVVVAERSQSSCALLYSLAQHFRLTSGEEIRPRVVHRLDRDTSGVLVIAKTLDCQRWLSGQFQEQKIKKTYLALVAGEVLGDTGSIDYKIRPASRRSTRMKASTKIGRDSLTHFTVIERFRGFTLLEVKPETGRTHQIRVHLSTIGHPLAVDPMYGVESELMLSSLKRKYRPAKGRPESPLIDRLTLHAASIEFQAEPEAGSLKFETEEPKDFVHLLRALRKYRKVSQPREEE